MNVRLEMRKAADPQLVASGDIYPPGSDSDTQPEVENVEVSAIVRHKASLPDGTWVYKFVAGGGSGKFEIWAVDAVSGAELNHDEYDTDVATVGLTLTFPKPAEEVP